MNDPLQYTFDDAHREQLCEGIAMSTAAKVAWFEMVTLAVRFGAWTTCAIDRRSEAMTLLDEWMKGPVILVAEGGLQSTLPPSSDPIADWIDFMETVEALCPKWPAPEPPRVGWVYRL